MDVIDPPLLFPGPFALPRDSHSWTIMIYSLSFSASTLNFSPLLFFTSECQKKPSGASTRAAEIGGLLDYYGFLKPFRFFL